ncbi:MAG: hypothetical protein N3A54_00485 [Patescibacteria group bacterium]|nr:hypothetical protein [Patescibacteria group bacterium]
MNFKDFFNNIYETKRKVELLESIEEALNATEKTTLYEKCNEYLNTALFLSIVVPLLEASANVIKTAVSRIPEMVDVLEDYVIYIDNKKYFINWDGGDFTIKNEENNVVYEGSASDATDLKKQVSDFFMNMEPESKMDGDFSVGEPTEEEASLDIDQMIETETDEEKRKKLVNLKQYIIPHIVKIFLKGKTNREEFIQALLKHIKDEKIPASLKSEVKSDIIKLFFNIIDIISSDRKMSSLLSTNAGTSIIYEAKTKKKRKSVLDSISKKLEYLLRLGLVDKKLVIRAKKALTMDKVTASTIKIYRDLILDILSEILEYIEKDQMIYNKIRMILSKKGTLNESVLDTLYEKCCCEEDDEERVLKEVSPPDFPEDLKKKLLSYYDDESIAYAVMWKIHKKMKRKKNRKGE